LDINNLLNYLKNVTNELESHKKETERQKEEYKTLLDKINNIETLILEVKKAIIG
jgi:septal ring factor EnvC (AmiA/AmiB activator)